MNLEILNDDALDIVAGGYKQCLDGTTSGGGPGLYPDYATCADPPRSMNDIINEIVTNVNNIVHPK